MRKRAFLVLGLSIILICASCGLRGPLKPPAGAVPAAVTDLKAETRAEGILLTWTAPALREDGKPLNDLDGFTVYRRGEDNCSDCPLHKSEFKPVGEVAAGPKAAGRPFQYLDRRPPAEKEFKYIVRAINLRGAENAPSNEVKVTP